MHSRLPPLSFPRKGIVCGDMKSRSLAPTIDNSKISRMPTTDIGTTAPEGPQPTEVHRRPRVRSGKPSASTRRAGIRVAAGIGSPTCGLRSDGLQSACVRQVGIGSLMSWTSQVPGQEHSLRAARRSPWIAWFTPWRWKRRWLACVTAGGLLFASAYPLSFGLALRMLATRQISNRAFHQIDNPLLWCTRGNAPARRALERSGNRFLPPPRRIVIAEEGYFFFTSSR